ncbi:MAG: UDP-N-acetylmuramoyl-L-alanyl-D-glutamate--2,6-diaminopimelate ligase [Ectothiorhodospiraceae bacterium]|nr:UDP-N-acetylmuramoyl-L-alanyl-D-glutamate--2,6-diaminopimelate ligase [Ectothiorhodospiraceae bacterium]
MFNQLNPKMHDPMAPKRLSDIISDVPVVQLFGPVDASVQGITTDSREVKPGWVFVALDGEHVDGHKFVNKAIESGASVVVIQEAQYEKSLKELLTPSYVQHNGTTVVIVRSTRIACAILSDRFYDSPAQEMRSVGITGTNGKTTVSYLLESIIAHAGLKPGVIGTIEYRSAGKATPAKYTTPAPEILHGVLRDMKRDNCDAFIMEVSSHALSLDRIYGMTFDVSIFTNLTQDHLDFHGTMDDYAYCKARLFSDHTAQVSIINNDDPYASVMLRRANGRKWTYGTSNDCDYTMSVVSNPSNGLIVEITHKDETDTVSSELQGFFNAYNITAAYTGALALGIEREAIIQGIRAIQNVPGRFELYEGPDGKRAIVDYAHTPDALKNVLQEARKIIPDNRNLILVFGCGGDRDIDKRPKMGKIAAEGSDTVIVTNDNPRTENPEEIVAQILAGIPEGYSNISVIYDREAAIHTAIEKSQPGDIVLVAGKGHEEYQVIGHLRRQFSDSSIVKDALGIT